MTIDNFDADAYKDKLREQGYRDDVLDNMVEKKKASLQKDEDESEIPFEYVMKFETIEKGEDLIIAGFASTGAIDWDDEYMNTDSLKSSWNDYMKNPVLRYMHSKDSRNPDAIGRVIPEYTDSNGKTYKTEFIDNKPFIVAKLSNALDVESIRTKISEGVVTGFSVGGRAKRVNEFCHKFGKNINQIFVNRISEISVVDLPANKDTFFEVIKSECIGNNCSCNIDEIINDNQNDSVTKVQDDDYQDENTVDKIKSEEINMTENIEMEMSELKEFVKSTVSEMIADQDQIEKLEAGDAAVKAVQDLKARIAELEAKVIAQAEELKARPEVTAMKTEIVEEIVVEDVKSEIDVLKAEITELKTSPLYKSEQGEIVEKGETVEPVSHLKSVISAHYGGK